MMRCLNWWRVFVRSHVIICAVLSTGLSAAHALTFERGVTFTPVFSDQFSKDVAAQGKLPVGFSEQVIGPLSTGYAQGADSDGARYLQVTLTNRSNSEMAHFGLFAGGQLLAQPGFVYRVNGKLSIARGRFQGSVAAGFHVLGSTGNYQTEITNSSARADAYSTRRQTLQAEYVGGTVVDRVGVPAAGLTPRLSVMNIGPGVSMTMRLFAYSVEKAPLPALLIGALPVRHHVLPGAEVRATVPIAAGTSLQGNLESTIYVLDAAGKVVVQYTHALPVNAIGNSGLIRDPWQFRAPESVGVGAQQGYRLVYELRRVGSGKGLKMVSVENAVVERISGAGYQYEIGGLDVSAVGGMLIGASFHHYPASSLGDSMTSLGPVKIKYRFSRSLANDHAAFPWWSFNGKKIVYDWGRFERWTSTFSKLGDKSLLIVFSGSPASGSLAPENRDNVMHLPGWHMPPKDLDLFGQVVSETVSRYKDRVFAVECWNEPDMPRFYGGTRTQLADMCKTLYQAVKKVHASIPVICPQTPNPDAMGYVLGATTSDGVPMTQFCDWLGAHSYKGIAPDASGRAYSAESLSDELALIRRRLKEYGLNKPVVITEFGFDRCMTNAAAGRGNLDQLSDGQKAEAVYQSLGTLAEEGVKMVTLYSYDLGYEPNSCARGGYLWTTNPSVTAMNSTVITRLNNAFRDFGATRVPW